MKLNLRLSAPLKMQFPMKSLVEVKFFIFRSKTMDCSSWFSVESMCYEAAPFAVYQRRFHDHYELQASELEAVTLICSLRNTCIYLFSVIFAG